MAEYALHAVVEHVRPFTNVLSSLRLSKKQLVRVGVSDRGVTFVAVDDSKSLQAQANFRAETFVEFNANPGAGVSQRGQPGYQNTVSTTASFDVSLQALIDTLNVFVPLDSEASVNLKWPDVDGRLVLSAVAERDGARASDEPLRNVTHAAISPMESNNIGGGIGTSSTSTLNSELVFRGEKNAFMVPTVTLKEIVDDLEWPGGGSTAGGSGQGTSITMHNTPLDSLRFTAKSQETGELVVDVDVPGGNQGNPTGGASTSALSEFVCDEPGTWWYRHKSLRAATAVPLALLSAPRGGLDASHDSGSGPTTTRVAIGEGGMLKIVHLVSFAGGSGSMFGGNSHGGNTNSHGGGTIGTNASMYGTGTGSENPNARGLGPRGAVVVPITFIAYPEELVEEDNET